MDFLTGYILGKESGRDNGGGSGCATPMLLILGIGIYKGIENFAIGHFSKYLIEMLIAYVLLIILIYRYSYKDCQRQYTIGLIYMALVAINFILCIVLGYVFFNVMGGTPFSYLIVKWNVLGWDTKGLLMDCIGEILWGALKVLDIVCKPFGFTVLHYIIIFFLKNKRNKRESLCSNVK